MTIYQGSRYEHAEVARVLAFDGTLRDTIMPITRPVPLGDVYHTVVDGDRIDTLALAYLGDSRQWWRIADVNPDWFYWDQLPLGLVLKVPNGSTTS